MPMASTPPGIRSTIGWPTTPGSTASSCAIEDKTDITGTGHEPWHYRYVGRDAAEEIHTQGVCLEEYLNAVD